jgi:hypothetical protein
MQPRLALALALVAAAVASCRSPQREAPGSVDAAAAIAPTRARPSPRSRELPNPIAYIPPQCFTKMVDDRGGPARNPCYACHVGAKPPNYVDDSAFQLLWSLPPAARDNPWTNLFSPPFLRAARAADDALLSYVRDSNYFDAHGNIVLAEKLRTVPAEWDLDHDGKWGGYVPDVWFHFDEGGFDHRPDGTPSGWRAFAYYPFLGTFFPTNGSADDVLIRLDPVLQQDAAGKFDARVYALNLAIVESLIKRADVPIIETDEASLGVDLDLDGKLGKVTRVAYDGGDGSGGTRMRYVGRARDDQREFPIAPGLFPLRTELFHSVRYLDVVADEGGSSNHVAMAARMKELRYAKKVRWLGYVALKGHVRAEAIEQRDARDGTVQIYSEFERGVFNGLGWVYQGFIEDKDGALRPQTFEESVYCVGCHGGIGATTDGVFSFARKLGAPGATRAYADGWFHWSRRDLRGLAEPRRADGSYEYTRYLAENGAGDELRENGEVLARFFDDRGVLRQDVVARLHADISTLLLPSPERALDLDRAYRAIVDEQSFVKGRDPVLAPAANVHAHPPIGQPTGIEVAVSGAGALLAGRNAPAP